MGMRAAGTTRVDIPRSIGEVPMTEGRRRWFRRAVTLGTTGEDDGQRARGRVEIVPNGLDPQVLPLLLSFSRVYRILDCPSFMLQPLVSRP